MKRFFVFFIIIFYLILSFSYEIISDGGALTTNIYKKNIKNIFETYEYMIYIPQSYSGTEEYSVIYLLSDDNIDPKILLQESSLHHYADKYKFFIILPFITKYNQNISKNIIGDTLKYIKENYMIKNNNLYTVCMFKKSQIFSDKKMSDMFDKFIFVCPETESFEFAKHKPTAVISQNKNINIEDGAVRINLDGNIYTWPGGKKSIPLFNRPNENNNFDLTDFVLRFFFSTLHHF